MGMLEISDALKENLQQIRGLKVFALRELPDSISQFPSLIMLPAETSYLTTFAADADYNMRLVLLFSNQDKPSAIKAMLPYIETSGDKSILQAVHADRRLNEEADDCKVVSNHGISSISWGGVNYLSTEFLVQIWAD